MHQVIWTVEEWAKKDSSDCGRVWPSSVALPGSSKMRIRICGPYSISELDSEAGIAVLTTVRSTE